MVIENNRSLCNNCSIWSQIAQNIGITPDNFIPPLMGTMAYWDICGMQTYIASFVVSCLIHCRLYHQYVSVKFYIGVIGLLIWKNKLKNYIFTVYWWCLHLLIVQRLIPDAVINISNSNNIIVFMQHEKVVTCSCILFQFCWMLIILSNH